MSSVENATILAAISAMETQLAALRAQISGKPQAASAAPAKTPAASGKIPAAPKEKKETTNPWVLFTARVRSVLKEAGYEKKTLGPEAVVFCGELKKENGDFASWSNEEILARRAAWTAPEIAKKGSGKKSAGSSAASVASDADADAAAPSEEPAKKKRGPPKGVKLSEEEKAKRKATREANKAKKEAASDAEQEAPASDSEADAAASTTSSQKKRGPKKFSEMTPEELEKAKAKRAENKAKKEAKKEAPASPSLSAAAIPLPPSPPLAARSAPAGFQPVMLKDESGRPARYYINLQTGHAYHRSEDNTQGHWAGLFSKTPKPHIDHSVAEPEAELNFTDLDELD